jgi:glutathione S-transferase
VARFILHLQPEDSPRRSELPRLHEGGRAALGVMERRLTEVRYLVGEHYSIADIALYAYTHVADEGGFDLAPFPAIRAWLERVRGQPGHIPITEG